MGTKEGLSGNFDRLLSIDYMEITWKISGHLSLQSAFGVLHLSLILLPGGVVVSLDDVASCVKGY